MDALVITSVVEPHGWRFTNIIQIHRLSVIRGLPKFGAGRGGMEGGGLTWLEREGEAQGRQSFKLIVTRYLVVAGKKRLKRMDDRPHQ